MHTYLLNKYSLTKRELEVLKLVINGYSNQEIAKILNVSPHTAKAHVSSLLEKFEVNVRVALAVKAVKDCLQNNIDL